MTGSAKPSFELHAGALRLALRPDLGGCIAGLWHRGTPILRSHRTRSADRFARVGVLPAGAVLQPARLPRFRWKGHDYTTQPNFDDQPAFAARRGLARPWEIVSSSVLELVLRLKHAGDADWPFAFEATQYFTLTPQSVHVEMVFTNTAEIAQPVGLGWHPYFPKRARSRLHIEVSDRWDCDATQLPTRKVAQPGIDSDVVAPGLRQLLRGLARPGAHPRREVLAAAALVVDRLVVFTPQDRDYFCVEPVSHVSQRDPHGRSRGTRPAQRRAGRKLSRPR